MQRSQISRIPSDTHGGDPCPLGKPQLIGVFSEEGHANSACTQDTRNQLRELAIAEHGYLAKLPERDLLQDFACCGEGLREYSLLVSHAFRNAMKVGQRHYEVLRERAILPNDSENAALLAMGEQTPPTKAA